MRAILAASATTTVLPCARARSPRSHMPIAVTVLLSRGIAALAPERSSPSVVEALG